MHFTIADLVADITQNGAEAGASCVELTLAENAAGANGRAEFRFTVRDNGRGMSPETLKHAQDPFVTDGIKHPHRKVGLGIPFMIQTAEQSGGGWSMESEVGKGTTTSAWFDMTNVDTPPLGDIPGLERTVLLFPGPDEMIIRRQRIDKDGYEVKKSELLEALGGFEDTGSLVLLDRYLRSLENDEGD